MGITAPNNMSNDVYLDPQFILYGTTSSAKGPDLPTGDIQQTTSTPDPLAHPTGKRDVVE